MQQHRLLPPIEINRQSMSANGRAYVGQPGQAIDVSDFDAGILEANGWIFVSLSGSTATRPTSTSATQSAQAGLKYFDTSLNVMIVFDGQVWRSTVDGSAA